MGLDDATSTWQGANMKTIKFISAVSGVCLVMTSLVSATPALAKPADVVPTHISPAQVAVIRTQFVAHFRAQPHSFTAHDTVTIPMIPDVVAERYRGVTYVFVTAHVVPSDSPAAQVALQDGNQQAIFTITGNRIAPRAIGGMGWPPCNERRMATYVPAPVAMAFSSTRCVLGG